MADRIKGSDIYEDDGTIRKAIKELKEMQSAVESLKQQTVEIEVEVKNANSAQAAHRETIKKAAIQTDKLEKELQKYADAIDESNIKLQAARQATLKANQLSKLTAQLKASEKGSYNALAAQYGINKLRLNQMSAAQRIATEEGQKLEKQSKEIYEEMKRLQEATGKHVLSVGDYEKGTSKLLDKLENMPGVLGNAANGVRGLGGQFKALLANPVVLLISGIVAGLTLMFQAFKKTERGADFMNKATGALQGVFSALIGIVDRIAGGIEKAFKDPKQALIDFGKSILDNIINRFKAGLNIATAFGRGIKALFSRDIEGLKQAAKDAGTAVIQLTTGMDAEDQANFVKEVKETTKSITDMSAAFANLYQQQTNVKRANREIIKTAEDLITQEAVLQSIIDDGTKSFAEREKAAEDLRKTTESRAKAEIQIARNNLSVINQELSLRRANGEAVEELLDSQLSAYQELRQAERDLTVSIRTNDKERAQLKQDRLERDLDILLDGFDNQKTINEKLIASDELTFSERRKLLEDTKKLSDDSFRKQVETIQQFTGIAIDANSLIGESDAVVLNEKIRSLGLSEIIEGRLLEIVRDRKTANQDLAESTKDLAKAETAAAAAAIKAQEEQQKAAYDNNLKQFDDRQKLSQAEFDLLKTTEAQKTAFRLEAERDRWQKIIDLSKEFGQTLSETEIKTIEATIQKIDQDLAGLQEKKGRSIYDLLGFKVSDEQKKSFSDSLSFAKDQLTSFAAKRVEIADKAVEKSKDEIEALQEALKIEIENRNAGYANNVETAQKELDDAKKRQKIVEREQEKAQRNQERIQSIEQTGNLITASSKLWSQLGLGAIPALAIMWGSFIASKARARTLSKKTYGDGGWDIIGGGSHLSGNDTYLGYESAGRPVYAEKGEMNATFSKGSTKKYRNLLPTIVDSLNAGIFENIFSAANTNMTVNPSFVQDTKNVEDILTQIRDKKEAFRYVNSENKLVEISGNTTTVYV